MKHKLRSIIATSVIAGTLLVPTYSFADAQQPISVFVDGQPLSFEVSPVIQDGTTLVPFRAVFEKFGLKVSWDGNTQTVTGTKDGLNIQMKIGDTNAVVNGRTTGLAVPPTVVQGSTLVPLRFVAETAQSSVKWNDASRTISIISEDKTKRDNTDIQLELINMAFFVKIDNDIYSTSSAILYKDSKDKYYIGSYNINKILELIAISNNEFIVEKTNNPFLKGDISFNGNILTKYFSLESKYLSITKSYNEVTFFNKDKSKTYFISENPDKFINVIKSDVSLNTSLISLNDLFLNLGMKIDIHNDKNNAVYFEILGQ